MKKISLSIATLLATLVFFAPLAYSADILFSTAVSSESAAVVAVEPQPQQVNVETSFVNVISDLMDSDVGYQFSESIAISLAYNPFSPDQDDIRDHQLDSDVYVGLKFSF